MSRPSQEVADLIAGRQAELAEAMVAAHYAKDPDLSLRYGQKGRQKCLEDALYHLSYLAEAVRMSSPTLFADYLGWARILLDGLGIPPGDLMNHLEIMDEELRRLLPVDVQDTLQPYLDAGRRQLSVPADIPSFIQPGNPLAELAEAYLRRLLNGERQAAGKLILDAVDRGTPVRDIYLHVFQCTQHELGRLWQTNRITVAQEHYCTAATQLIMSQLYPRIFSTEKIGRRLVASCVSGELHEIGVRMVADFFEMEGWDTYYLGANTPTEAIVKAIEDRRPDLLAFSATMTFHVGVLAKLVEDVRKSEAGKTVRILVGGYPFNVSADLWKKVGADGWAGDAEGALALVRDHS